MSAVPGLWSNSCCTHPIPGETVVAAGERRVVEELGVRCRLVEVGTFTYRAEDPRSGLVEHEVDHVLVGRTSDEPDPDPLEVSAIMVLDLASLTDRQRTAPDHFSPWLPGALAVLARTTLPDWTVPGPARTDEVDPV